MNPSDEDILRDNVSRLERRIDLTDEYRHEMRNQIQKIDTEQAIIRTELQNQTKDIIELSSDILRMTKALWIGFTFVVTLCLTALGILLAQGGIH